jgi:hypothetical protein
MCGVLKSEGIRVEDNHAVERLPSLFLGKGRGWVLFARMTTFLLQNNAVSEGVPAFAGMTGALREII